MSPNPRGPGEISTRRLPHAVASGSLVGLLKTDEYTNPASGFCEVTEHRMDLEIPLPKFDLEKSKLRWGGKWIRHKPGKYDILVSYGPPTYCYLAIITAKGFSDDERSELIRFLLTLELWDTTPGEKEISAQEIWISSLRDGPKYTEYLDDYFALSWREREIDSYNFVFPSRFMPRWEEYTNDLILCQDRTWVTDDGVLDEFRSTLEDLLDEIPNIGEISLPSDASITFERSTTTSYVHHERAKKPQWEASLDCDRFNTSELVGLRCVVPVYPGGIRDTIIADISANNSIRWLERAMRHLLEHVPESAVTLSAHTFQTRLEDVVYTKGSHVLRDIKKCGITYNTHDLFPVVKECIMKRIPDNRWNRYDIYSNMKIIDDDFEYEALRGYGLGMANHTVTLCNIVIHRMARNVLARGAHSAFSMKAICGNDDEDVVIFRTRHHRELAKEYMEIEHDIHGALGNLINVKKSVVKPYGLFYETYNKDGWENKEALVCNALACAYLAPNIRVAKHYIMSQSNRFNSGWARGQLRRLAEYWGDEFFDKSSEIKIHYEVGGWLDTRSLGLKTTLRDVEKLSERYSERRISFAIETCKQYLKPPTPAYKTPATVSNFRYCGPAKITDPKIQIYTIGEEDLRWYYKRLTKFQRNFSSRLEKYQSRVMNRAIKDDIRSIHEKLLRREPWYAIPDTLVEEDFPPQTSSFNHTTEQTMHGDDILDNMLRQAHGFEHNLVIDDANTSWNPQIPTSVRNKEIHVDITTQLCASQYSNSGYLPILEYFERYEAYPKCAPYVGRMRIPAPHRKGQHFSLKTSFYRFKPRPKKDKITEADPTEIVEPEIEEGPFQSRLLQIMEEYDVKRPVLENISEIKVLENISENVDDLLDLLQSKGGLATMSYDNPRNDQDETPSFFDDDDEEGFNFFGEEEY